MLRWDPEVIVTIDLPSPRRCATTRCGRACARCATAACTSSPKLPFGWVDFPPGVNRLIGLWWLGKMIFPPLFPEDLKAITREFYKRFYHVDLSDAQVERVLAGRD